MEQTGDVTGRKMGEMATGPVVILVLIPDADFLLQLCIWVNDFSPMGHLLMDHTKIPNFPFK